MYTIEQHFTNKSENVRQIYDHLIESLNQFGVIEIEAKKTSLHLVNRTALAGVYTRKNYINLNIKTDYPLDNPRIRKSEKISANRYHHELRLESVTDVDTELMGWLKDAYILSQ